MGECVGECVDVWESVWMCGRVDARWEAKCQSFENNSVLTPSSSNILQRPRTSRTGLNRIQPQNSHAIPRQRRK